MSRSNNDTVVLLMTHFIDDIVLSEYRKLKADAGEAYDVRMLLNLTEFFREADLPADVDRFTFTAADIRKLGYRSKNTEPSSFNVELHDINFFLNNQGYQHYWSIEYDVRFSGNWRVLFDHFKDDQADLLGSTMFRYSDNPAWENWPSLVSPRPLADDEKLSAFLPVYRISNRALRTLDHAYRNGWGGHCECSVPSALQDAGLVLEDMGGDSDWVRPGNTNRFYFNNPMSWHHGPGSLVFRPVREQAGHEPNKLWHPVKTPDQGWATGKRKIWWKARTWMANNLRAIGR